MGLAPAKGTRLRAEVGRAVEIMQGWPDKAAGEGEAERASICYEKANKVVTFALRA